MRWTFILLALTACKGIDNGFAVDLTVEADPSVNVAATTQLSVDVTEAETYHTVVAVTPTWSGLRQERIAYRPSIGSTGELKFVIQCARFHRDPAGCWKPNCYSESRRHDKCHSPHHVRQCRRRGERRLQTEELRVPS